MVGIGVFMGSFNFSAYVKIFLIKSWGDFKHYVSYAWRNGNWGDGSFSFPQGCGVNFVGKPRLSWGESQEGSARPLTMEGAEMRTHLLTTLYRNGPQESTESEGNHTGTM